LFFIKRFLYVLTVSLLPFFVKADHIYGGEIIVNCIDTNNGVYQIDLFIRRKCSNVLMPNQLSINIQTCQVPNSTFVAEYVGATLIPSTCSESSNCSSLSNLQSFEIVNYRTTALLGKNCGLLNVSYSAPSSRVFNSNLLNTFSDFYIHAVVNSNFPIVSSIVKPLNVYSASSDQKFQDIITIFSKNSDSISIELSAPFVGQGTNLLNPILANLKSGLNSKKLFYIKDSIIELNKNIWSFMPLISQNGYVNFVIKEYKKNTLNQFQLIHQRNIEEYLILNNTTNLSALIDVKSDKSQLKKVDSNSWISCSYYTNDTISFRFLLPKSINQFRFKNRLFYENDIFKPIDSIVFKGAFFDTLKFSYLLKSFKDNEAHKFIFDIFSCQNNQEFYNTLEVNLHQFEEDVFLSDTIISCQNDSIYNIPLNSLKSVSINIDSFAFFQSNKLTFDFSNPKSTEIYATFSTINPFCKTKDTLTFIQSSPIKDSLNIKHVSCFGYSDGKVRINLSGGNPPYTLNWLGINTSFIDSIENLKKGNYEFEVKDFNKCTKKIKFEIQEPGGIVAQWNSTSPIRCFGDSNAQGHFSIHSNMLPTNYIWNQFIHQDSFQSNLKAGLYSGQFLYTNVNGVNCSQPFEVKIVEPNPIDFTTFIKNNECYGDSNGVIAVNPNGGNGFYTYFLNEQLHISSTLSNLKSGTYNLKVKDISNCFSENKNLTILSPNKITTKIFQSNPYCKEVLNGKIEILSTSGGSGQYVYAIDSLPFSHNTVYHDLKTKPFIKITTKDFKGCFSDTFVNFSPYYKLKAKLFLKDTLKCNNDKTGVLDLELLNGLQPFYVDISNISYRLTTNKSLIQNMYAGVFDLKIKDSFGCQWDSLVTINAPDSLFIEEEIKSPTCINDQNGSVKIKLNGGVPPYKNLKWNQSLTTTLNFDNLISDNYIFSFEDANHCFFTKTISVPNPETINYTYDWIQKPKCIDDSSGVLNLNFKDKKPVSVYWQNTLLMTNRIDKVKYQKNYNIKFIDSNGCQFMDSIYFEKENYIKSEQLRIKNPSCLEKSDGIISLDIAPDSLNKYNLSFSINNFISSQKSPIFFNLSHNITSLYIKDTFQCVTILPLKLAPLKELKVNVKQDRLVVNPGEVIDLIAQIDYTNNTNASDIITKNWSSFNKVNCDTCAETNSQVIKKSFYSYNILYGNQCFASDTILVDIYPIQEVYIPNAFSIKSPSGNACWSVFGNFIKNMETKVFNELGECVFQSNKKDFCWNGTYRNQIVLGNIFYYQISVIYYDDTKKHYAGELFILK
jgi:hypothetical protein